MNYREPQLLDELAAQYVLGTLRGPARRRFERFYRRDMAALVAVRRWEDRLVELIAEVTPVAPPALVWDRIRLRIKRERAQQRKQTFGAWRTPGYALAAGIATLAIAIGMWTGFGPSSTEPFAKVVNPQQAQLWEIKITRAGDELRVVAGNDLGLDASRAYELWALPGANVAPVSLGLMPKTGRGTLQLNDAQRLALSRSRQIAISLEPPGGSPTGAPTGPVLFVADVAAG
jgi:anti-sigma-K factor RskA